MNRQPAILFVDDEEMARKYFQRAFADRFTVLVADSAATALALLEDPDRRIGVLVSDQRMPLATGVDLLAECRRRFPLVVRLLTSAYASLDDALAAVNQGEVYRFITKPWDLEQVARELSAAVELHRTRQRERELLAARRQTLLQVGASVAHEMRTPLSSVGAAAGGIRRYLPALLAAYDQARAAGLAVEEIRAAHRQRLGETLDHIEHTVRQAHTVIDLLLMNARDGDTASARFQDFSMADCVARAIADYPMTDAQRGRVQTELIRDFRFRGSDELMVYVLFNLLRNGLYALEAAGRGGISIRLEPQSGFNALRFRDTGTGIPAAIRQRIFDDFFTGKDGHAGTGMGLAFCRRVIEHFGGSIDCASEEGSYTEFSIRLPEVTDP